MKTKKIAVLTFFKSGNFGGELQAYALQKKLRELGYDVEVLHQLRPTNKNFKYSEKFKPIFTLTDKKSKRSKINSKISKIIKYFLAFFSKNQKVKLNKFEEFEHKHINLSKKTYCSFEDLYTHEMDYDVFIAGSDQIWNYSLSFSPEPYFLTFADDDKTKISYAASIGHSEIPDNVGRLYKKWLDSFNFISTREEQGAQLLENLLGKQVETVIDPTLLIKKEDWCRYFQIQEETGEKYLLIYTLVESKFVFKTAIEIANKLNLKIKRILPVAWTRENYDEVENILDAGPIDFVRLFANASFVITNSFHGTAFSVNFNIPFLSVPREYKKTNSRFINLLHLTNLSDRLVYDGSPIVVDEFLKADFQKSNLILEKERDRSLSLLLKAINS